MMKSGIVTLFLCGLLVLTTCAGKSDAADGGELDNQSTNSNSIEYEQENLSFLLFPDYDVQLADLDVLIENIDSINVFRNATSVLIEQEDYQNALKTLSAQMMISSDDFELYRMMKFVLEKIASDENDNKKKLQLYYRMLDLNYDDTEMQSRIESLANRINPELTRYSIRPVHRDALKDFNAGMNLWDKEEHDKAIICFESAANKMLAIDVPNFLFTSLLGMVYQSLGYPQKALAALNSIGSEKTVLEEKAINQLQWGLSYLNEHAAPDNSSSTSYKILYAAAKIYTGSTTEGANLLINLIDSGNLQGGKLKLSLFLTGLAFNRAGKYFDAVDYISRLKDIYEEQIGDSEHVCMMLYKVQLEDQRSIEVIAQKFRTNADWIRSVNFLDDHDEVRDYQIIIIPRFKGQRTFIIPAHGLINSLYGRRLDPFTARWNMHTGIDIKTSEGENAYSAADGTVTVSYFSASGGNMVVVDHGRGMSTRYLHAEELLVEVGDSVQQGDPVIETGNTGHSVSRHLHFETRYLDNHLNPLDYF